MENIIGRIENTNTPPATGPKYIVLEKKREREREREKEDQLSNLLSIIIGNCG